jgi:hypothetical protein
VPKLTRAFADTQTFRLGLVLGSLLAVVVILALADAMVGG